MESSTLPNSELVAKNKPELLDKQKWIAFIEEWENSNESQKAFCERLQLNHNTFSYMRAQVLSKRNKTENKFIAVKVKEETPAQNNLLIIENNKGIKLQVSIDINEAKLAHILRVIGWHPYA